MFLDKNVKGYLKDNAEGELTEKKKNLPRMIFKMRNWKRTGKKKAERNNANSSKWRKRLQ